MFDALNSQYLLDCFFRLVETPSPVSYHVKMNPVLTDMAAKLGLDVTFDNRSNAYIRMQGENTEKTVLVSAHADTVGMLVRGVDGEGRILFRSMGSPNLCSAESENVTVHTRDGKTYTGILICTSHSIHAFDDTRTKERNDDTMVVVLDEPVATKADVEKLGIRAGDIISIDARPTLTENGYLKSRYIDDKGAVACIFATLRALTESGKKPKYNTIFQITYYEENSGGIPIPDGVSEMIGLDIGIVASGQASTERGVSICAKDFSNVYDYTFISELSALAERIGCTYAVDVFYRYGSDVGMALKAGKDIRAALFGMGVLASHGVERTHVSALENTAALLYAYLTE